MKNCNEILNDYMDNEYAIHKKGTTMTRCSSIRTSFLPKFGELYPNLITTKNINDLYLDMKENGYAQNTIYGFYCAIRSFFRFIVKHGYGDNNPTLDAMTISHK